MALDPLLVLVASVLLGGLFAIGGISKLMGFAEFVATVGNYRLLPDPLVLPVALLVASSELLLGLAALVSSRFGMLMPSLFGIAALLLIYAASIGINLLRGRRHIDCGCNAFAAEGAPLNWYLAGRNAVLAVVALGVASAIAMPRPLAMIDWISALGTLVAFPLLYVAFGQLSAASFGKAMS